MNNKRGKGGEGLRLSAKKSGAVLFVTDGIKLHVCVCFDCCELYLYRIAAVGIHFCPGNRRQ